MVIEICVQNRFEGYPWHMTVDLEHLCAIEGEKSWIGSFNGRDLYRISMPTDKVRKLFALLIENGEPEDVEAAAEYLKKNSKKYGIIFQKQQTKSKKNRIGG